jgi:hypothetical protein
MHNLAPVKHHSAKARLGDSCVWRNIVKPERGSNADACPVHVRYKSDACPVRLVGNADEDWRGSLVSDLSWVDPSNLTAMFERSHSCACTRAFNATASSSTSLMPKSATINAARRAGDAISRIQPARRLSGRRPRSPSCCIQGGAAGRSKSPSYAGPQRTMQSAGYRPPSSQTRLGVACYTPWSCLTGGLHGVPVLARRLGVCDRYDSLFCRMSHLSHVRVLARYIFLAIPGPAMFVLWLACGLSQSESENHARSVR